MIVYKWPLFLVKTCLWKDPYCQFTIRYLNHYNLILYSSCCYIFVFVSSYCVLFSTQAVCCSDHVHCCPQGTKCDIQQKKCIGRGVNLGTITMEMIEVKDNSSPQQPLQGFPLTALKENTVCPDGQSECKTGQTCCKLPSGMYGCCPLPKVGIKGW